MVEVSFNENCAIMINFTTSKPEEIIIMKNSTIIQKKGKEKKGKERIPNLLSNESFFLIFEFVQNT